MLRDDLDRRLAVLALPALGALAVEPLYVLVDTAIVGRLGTDPLASLALASIALLTVVAGCNFLAYGTTQRVAHRLGADDPTGAADAGVQALWVTAAIGLPATLALVVLARPIGAALGGNGVVLDGATTYLRIGAVGLPFVLVTLAGQGVLRGHTDLRTPLVILAAANALNVVLEIVAVYVLDLRLAGSAWSTVVAQAFMAGWFGVVVRRRLRPARARRPVWAEMAPLLSAGRHLVQRVGTMLMVIVVAAAVAARVDTPTLAAHQIVMQSFNLLALVLDALAIPAQTLVAGALGAGERAHADRIGRAVVRLAVVSGVVLAVGVVLLAPALPWAFTRDGAVISRAAAGLVILAITQLPAALAMSLDGVLIGAGDYRFLSRAAAVNALVFAPVAALTLGVPALGIVGVWAAMFAWMCSRAVANRMRFRSGAWAE